MRKYERLEDAAHIGASLEAGEVLSVDYKKVVECWWNLNRATAAKRSSAVMDGSSPS